MNLKDKVSCVGMQISLASAQRRGGSEIVLLSCFLCFFYFKQKHSILVVGNLFIVLISFDPLVRIMRLYKLFLLL